LETSKEILSEIRENSELVRKAFEVVRNPDNFENDFVGKGTLNRYFSLGSFKSEKVGDLFVGVKIPQYCYFASNDFLCGGAYGQILSEEFGEEIIGELPLFYGLLAEDEDSPLATISQDFSEGGKYVVSDCRHLNKFLLELFEGDNYELEKCGIEVNGQRKLVDFNHLIRLLGESYLKRDKELKDELENNNFWKIFE